ncbi:MAG: hypothetical protein IJ345_01965 [Clostridia bacterium]|nr:hypothetical protein [Clostridia bacterium]
MIRFEGEISSECKKFIRKREVKTTLLGGTFAFAVIAYPFIALFSKWTNSIVASILMYLLGVAAFVLMAFVAPTKKDIDSLSPTKISICLEEGYIEATCQRFTLDRDLSDIKEVVDHGDWFSFKFSGRGAPAHRFICQKDLIVEGAIDEFVGAFAEKITKAEA